MKRLAVFCLFLISPAFPAVCRAEGLSLGVGYPYLSLKYDFKALAAEGRFVTGSGVQAYTGRGYWNFHQSDNLKGFTGLEGGYIKFNTLDTKGTGSEVAVFVGGEYFVAKNFSLLMDFAPTLISLKHDTHSDIKASSIEYVVNLGFYYHFGGSRSKAEVHKTSATGSGTNRNAIKMDEIRAVSAAPLVTPAEKETASPEVIAWLAQLKSPDWRERRKAAFELGKVKAAEAMGPLLELLGDENEKVCGVAARALGRIGDRRVLAPLIERLEDESSYVRASAAKALGYLGDTRSVKPLERALTDDSGEVRKAAEEALNKFDSE